MNCYNGYTPKERERKLRASYKAYPNHSHPFYQGACQICGDSRCAVEPHTEDYSEPYLWTNPAEYAVCKTCHSRLHKRFNSPFAWRAYKAHVSRGGFGSDLKTSSIRTGVTKFAKALEAGQEPSPLPTLPERTVRPAGAWWDQLTLDSDSLTNPNFRPRP